MQAAILAEGSDEPLSRGYDPFPVSTSFALFDASAVVYSRSSSRRLPDPLIAGLLRSRFPPRLLTGMTLRWFGFSAYSANPEGLPPSLVRHVGANDLLHRHHFTFQDTRS
jgi:hypothetical protein